MSPMLSRPIPEVARKKKPKTPERKPRAGVTAGVIGAAAVAGCALALLLWGALRVRREEPVVAGKDRTERVAEMLETGNKWFLDPDAAKLPRAKKLMDEADKRGAKAVHYHQKSSLVEFNLRSIVDVPEPAEKDSKDAETKKAPEAEGGAAPLRGEKPQPAPTNERGEIIRGKAGTGEDDGAETAAEEAGGTKAASEEAAEPEAVTE